MFAQHSHIMTFMSPRCFCLCERLLCKTVLKFVVEDCRVIKMTIILAGFIIICSLLPDFFFLLIFKAIQMKLSGLERIMDPQNRGCQAPWTDQPWLCFSILLKLLVMNRYYLCHKKWKNKREKCQTKMYKYPWSLNSFASLDPWREEIPLRSYIPPRFFIISGR